MSSLQTAIEWTDATWNPTTGCERVSPGCDNCYALTLAKRLKAMGNPRYQVDGPPRTSGPGFGLTLHWDVVDQPRRWRRPRRVFVNSMSDLFHNDVPDDFVRRVFETMEATPHHTFQILTKRPRRMASLVTEIQPEPLPNVWLGTSVEDQKRADLRVPLLIETPAVVRFLSCEPLLGPVSIADWVHDLHWVITGGESGHGFRPVEAEWVRTIRDQCSVASVAFFHKQWGGRTPKARGRMLDGRTYDEMPNRVVPA